MRHKTLPSNHTVRQQREVARAFNGHREHAMMLGTVAGGPCRNHFAALGHEVAEDGRVLVVHIKDAVHAESADFSSGRAPAPGASAPIVTAVRAEARRPGTSSLRCGVWHKDVLSLEPDRLRRDC